MATLEIDTIPRWSPVFSDHEIRLVAEGDPKGISKWAISTAEARGISLLRGASDIFARAASRLSDAETDLDQTEELLISLSRAHIITPFQRGLLHVHYLHCR